MAEPGGSFAGSEDARGWWRGPVEDGQSVAGMESAGRIWIG